QKYLRNEYASIDEYNEMAGEVAEPYRFLVVANFPTSFSDSAIRRLYSIASSGARCGVYTLISADLKHPLPHGFTLKELEQHSNILLWKEGKLVWKDSDFERYPLKLDVSPPTETLTTLMKVAGQRAKDANRVEVPFDYIAPAPDRWWTADSSQG